MDASLVAAIAAARLALPIPTAKSLTAWEFAKALGIPAGRKVGWPALLEWVGTCKFESQVLEGLAPLVISGCTSQEANEIRKLVKRPSMGMDLMLTAATNQPLLVPSWRGCHSGPAPRFAELSAEESLLESGRILPGIFVTEFEQLQEESDRPFMTHWAYEFQVLSQTRGFPESDQFDYFVKGERGARGMVVGQRSHAARSAFLRTLAYACEYWQMPFDRAQQVAVTALPGEASLMKMIPGRPPAFAQKMYAAIDGGELSANKIAFDVVDALRSDPLAFPMHFSGCVHDSSTLTIDVGVYAIPLLPGQKAGIWIHWYRSLLGRLELERDGTSALKIPALRGEQVSRDESHVMPLLAPILPERVGYFHADLIQRPPYVPAWVPGDFPMLSRPREGGMTLELNGTPVGSMQHWLANWAPLVAKDGPAGTACCTHVEASLLEAYERIMGRRVAHACSITIGQREKDYGDWAIKTVDCIVGAT